MKPQDNLLRVNEVSERLGVRPSTIRAWILHRRIAVVRVGKRAIRVKSSTVQEIVEAGTIPVRQERP